jgi:hypothetical protein
MRTLFAISILAGAALTAIFLYNATDGLSPGTVSVVDSPTRNPCEQLINRQNQRPMPSDDGGAIFNACFAQIEHCNKVARNVFPSKYCGDAPATPSD